MLYRAARLLLTLLIASPAGAYYGRSSTEASLSFDGAVDAPLDEIPSVGALNGGGKIRELALEMVDEQVSYLTGTFQSESFLQKFHYPGTLDQDESGSHGEIEFTGAQAAGEGRVRLSYHFKGNAIFHKDAFRHGSVRTVPLKMPYAPDAIYKISKNGGKKNLCTDPHYDGPGDFFYFWDPDKPDCPLNGDDTNVLRTSGRLEKKPNTRTTYPDYDRLFSGKDGADPLKISIFFGFIDPVEKLKKPNMKYKDDAYLNMKGLEEKLGGEFGFTFNKEESQTKFRLDRNGNPMRKGGINYMRVWEKSGRYRGKTVNIRLELYLTDTASDSKDATFHQLLITALKESDVFLYDGHSGLGANLDLGMEDLEGVKLDPERYQIFFFNGCTTYPYFTKMYLNAKGGGRNMQIITTGQEADTATSVDNAANFLEPFVNLHPLSYQTILGRLDDSNGDVGNTLYGVSGDEESKWRPRR
ncbi:MAG: hypothetical protein ACHQ2Z_03120 [Elusimicrobiota bacterium]